MNSLAHSRSLMLTFPDIIESLSKVKFNDYLIPKKMLESQEHDILRSCKYTLSPLVHREIEHFNRIIPVILQDPVDHLKSGRDDIPQNLIVLPRQVGLDYIAYLDLSLRCEFKRDSNKIIKSVDIRYHDLYNFYELATVQILCRMRSKKLETHVSLQNDLSRCYAYMVGKVLDSIYTISGTTEEENFTILLFLLQLFFLENHVGYDKKKSIDIIFNYNKKEYGLYRDIILSKVQYIESSSTFMDGCDYKTKFPIMNLIEVLRNQFILMESMTVSDLLFAFSKRYKGSAILAAESYYSFMMLIQLINLKSDIVNAKLAKDFLDTMIPSIMKSLLEILR